MKKILIVEDEQDIREMLQFALEPRGFLLTLSDSAASAWTILEKEIPDLILLDWMLPGISGIQFIKKIREKDDFKDIPIILLTAKAEEFNKVMGLETGADDYITKPFSVKELIARIHSVLRRTTKYVDAKGNYEIFYEPLRLGIKEKNFYYQDQLLHLTKSEFLIFETLFKKPQKVFSRSELLDHIKGFESDCSERTIDAIIKRLRKKLAPFSLLSIIKTVRGFGYQLGLLD